MEQESIKKLPSVAETVDLFTQKLGLTETECQYLRAYLDFELLEVDRTVFMDSVIEDSSQLEMEAHERYGLGPNMMKFLDDIGFEIVIGEMIMRSPKEEIEQMYKKAGVEPKPPLDVKKMAEDLRLKKDLSIVRKRDLVFYGIGKKEVSPDDIEFYRLLFRIQTLFPEFRFFQGDEFDHDDDKRIIYYLSPGDLEGGSLTGSLFEEAGVRLIRELAHCQFWIKETEDAAKGQFRDFGYLTGETLTWDRVEEIVEQLGLDKNERFRTVLEKVKAKKEESMLSSMEEIEEEQ